MHTITCKLRTNPVGCQIHDLGEHIHVTSQPTNPFWLERGGSENIEPPKKSSVWPCSLNLKSSESLVRWYPAIYPHFMQNFKSFNLGWVDQVEANPTSTGTHVSPTQPNPNPNPNIQSEPSTQPGPYYGTYKPSPT